MAVHFPVQVQSFRFRQSLSLWERWHGVSRDGEGEPAAPQRRAFAESGAVNAVCRHDPTREKAILENPQIFQNCEI